MKLLTVPATVLVVAAAAAASVAAAEQPPATVASSYDELFESFKNAHRKGGQQRYATADEEAKAKRNFISNMKKAAVLQAANPLASFGAANEFADMSAADFAKSRLNGKRQYEKMAEARRKRAGEEGSLISPSGAARKAAAGQKVDWREQGKVTAVKNQGSCGSCWAFSVTGNIESQWAMAGNNLTTVSEQELVACDFVPDSNEGCDGGWMDTAMQWIVQQRNGEIVTEASYPYAAGGGYSPKCRADLDTLPVGAKLSAYKNLETSEDAMAAFVFTGGALSIALDASSFQMYSSGIVTNCIAQEVNHAVLIVGYDDTNVPPYWIIKNSWGARWGEEGYIRVAKGTNQCLLNEYPVTAII